MIEIKVGTICILTGGHSRAGQCCEVTGPLSFWGWTNFDANTRGEGMCYPIELASGEPSFAAGWVAEPHNLIPIAPPGLTEGEDTRQPVREVA